MLNTIPRHGTMPFNLVGSRVAAYHLIGHDLVGDAPAASTRRVLGGGSVIC